MYVGTGLIAKTVTLMLKLVNVVPTQLGCSTIVKPAVAGAKEAQVRHWVVAKMS